MNGKNYNKENKYSFANINLLGECNADCYFCLGKDLRKELSGKDQTDIRFIWWRKFNIFLDLCDKHNIKKIYLTGQNVDALQYGYFDELREYLQDYRNFHFGIRTNGFLLEEKLNEVEKCNDEIGITINSLNPKTNRKIMGNPTIPNWDEIIPKIKNCRISIVVNRYNVTEFFNIVKYISRFPNVRYIQARRISTENRFQCLEKDINIYEELFHEIKNKYKQIGEFHLAQQFNIYGKEVNFWRTVETSINSINYFTDGTISEEYFIIEGYLKNYEPRPIIQE